MKKTIKIAAIAAILFAITVYMFLQQQTVTRQIVVAATAMPVGTVVTAEMVKTEAIPVTALMSGGLVSDIASVVGKTVIAERAVGDVIPFAVLGDARRQPQEGKGFVTVSVPVGGAAGAAVGDTVAVAVFGHFEGSGLLEGFTVVGLRVGEREMQLVLEADLGSLLLLAPHLSARSFIIIRR
ncbi:MAG: hypothetical protein DDT20_01670 [Firmicutes bacterium]|nr:hypothetical protein [Bacillota bacterium]